MVGFRNPPGATRRILPLALTLRLASSQAARGECTTPRDAAGDPHGVEQCFDALGLSRVTTYVHGKKQGQAKRYYFPNHLEVEENYRDDRLEGLTRYYTQDGLLKEEKNYKSGELNGEVKTYYHEEGQGGKVESIDVYRDGEKHGLSQRFSLDGKLLQSTSYEKGVRRGPEKKFWDDGKPNEFRNWKDDNTPDGEQRRFYDDGQLQEIWNEKSGERHGLATSYHKNGKVEKVTCYQNGKEFEGLGACQGRPAGQPEVAETFSKEGTSRERYTIVNGQKNGPYSVHHSNGQLAETGTYRTGQVDGEIRAYDKKGHLQVVGNFQNGKRHGSEKRYSADGKLLKESVWEKGLLQQERTYYLNGRMRAETLHQGPLILAKGFWDNGNLKFIGTFGESVESARTGELRFTEPPARRLYGAIEFNPWGGSVEGWRALLEQGVHKSFRENGSLLLEISYKDGKPDGPRRRYHRNGKIAEEVGYKNGVLSSRKKYDDSGKLTLSEEYYEDGSRKSKSP